jgi:hypothetical protein
METIHLDREIVHLDRISARARRELSPKEMIHLGRFESMLLA